MKLLLSLLMFFTGCAVSNSKYFRKIVQVNDERYGYNSFYPVPVWNDNIYSSIDAVNYYISHLRSKNGNKLICIERNAVSNPRWNKSNEDHILRTQFGMMNSQGARPVIDLYVLVPENEKDTIRLYINPYITGPLGIPVGLTFQKD